MTAQAKQPVVAVFAIKNEARLNQTFVKQLHDVVSAEVTKNNQYSVIPNSEVQKALRAKKKESYKSCYDE